MNRQVAATSVLGLTLLLVGCGDDGKTTDTKSSASPGQGQGSSSAAPAGTQVGGASNGVVLTLPPGWKQVDPIQDTSEVVQTSFGLTGERGGMIKQLLVEQVKIGVLFAYDTSVTQGFAPHLQAGCDRGGIIGASQEQLRKKQKALTPDNLKIKDLTVGGKPAFEATYTEKRYNEPSTVEGSTVRVTIAADRFCFVDLEAKPGTTPPAAAQIRQSFRPA